MQFEVGKKYITSNRPGDTYECVAISETYAILQSMYSKTESVHHRHSDTWEEHKEPRILKKYVAVLKSADGKFSFSKTTYNSHEGVYRVFEKDRVIDIIEVTYEVKES